MEVRQCFVAVAFALVVGVFGTGAVVVYAHSSDFRAAADDGVEQAGGRSGRA